MSEHFLVRIYESELAVIAKETLDHQDLETGGSLFGLFSHGGGPTIFLATRPAGRVTKLNHSLELDPHVTKLLEEISWKGYGVQCIGMWHSHHWIGLMEPSSGDRERTRRYAQRYERPQYTEILANLVGERPAAVHVQLAPFFYLDARELTRAETAFEVLPGISPLRQALAEYQRDPQLDGALKPAGRIRDDAYRLVGSAGTSSPGLLRRLLGNREPAKPGPESAGNGADDMPGTGTPALTGATERRELAAPEAPEGRADEDAAPLQADADANADPGPTRSDVPVQRPHVEHAPGRSAGPGSLQRIPDLADYVTHCLQPTVSRLADRNYHVELQMISDSRIGLVITRRGAHGHLVLLTGWDGRDAVCFGCEIIQRNSLIAEWPSSRPDQTFAIEEPLDWGLNRLAQLR